MAQDKIEEPDASYTGGNVADLPLLTDLVRHGIVGGYTRDAALDLLSTVRAYRTGVGSREQLRTCAHWDRLRDLLTATSQRGVDPTRAIIRTVWVSVCAEAELSTDVPGEVR